MQKCLINQENKELEKLKLKSVKLVREYWSALFVSNIINLGITSKKSSILSFPDIEESYYSYFIAGLFDGDGSISFKNDGKVTCNLISTKEILDFIQEYLKKSF